MPSSPPGHWNSHSRALYALSHANEMCSPRCKFNVAGNNTYDICELSNPQYILRLLALDECADTIVGSGMVRGISGGQRKRVTTGEMIVGCVSKLNTKLQQQSELTTYCTVAVVSSKAHAALKL